MFAKDGKIKDVKTPRICDVVWHDGEFIKWNDARVHVAIGRVYETLHPVEAVAEFHRSE